ncbi:hypothetical protein RFI_23865 [Reticulomyxa filosa]|uniref:Uncharacterized protein n=1 Tax=Reticulomyxa filosa TaxID=46433 RepID=X6MHL6_RETFI|nr:hypothetical protein RFI_23865 [Reticulomyxa filosa]|eukprot:ETO13503.1 hypothetical protein RFI_23865 [Reticulomyxa filosa]
MTWEKNRNVKQKESKRKKKITILNEFSTFERRYDETKEQLEAIEALDKKWTHICQHKYDNMRKVYEKGNAIIELLRIECKRVCKNGCKCSFKSIYGAVLGGSVQKTVSITENMESDLIFLYKLRRKTLIKENLPSIEKQQQDMMQWIKDCLVRRHQQVGREKQSKPEFGVHSSSNNNLRITTEDISFDVLVTFTYDVRQYCMFDYKTKFCTVYPFTREELHIAAQDLLECSDVYQQDIATMEQEAPDAYYTQEALLGNNTRNAILFLKKWKYEETKEGLGTLWPMSKILELLCVNAYHSLQREKFSPLLSIRIVKRVFEMLSWLGEHIHSEHVIVISWPLLQCSHPLLVRCTKGVQKMIAQNIFGACDVVVLDNVVLSNFFQKKKKKENLENFGKWKDLACVCEAALIDFPLGRVSEFIETCTKTLKDPRAPQKEKESSSEKEYVSVKKIIEHCFTRVTEANVVTITNIWKSIQRTYNLPNKYFFTQGVISRELYELWKSNCVQKCDNDGKDGNGFNLNTNFRWVGTPSHAMQSIINRYTTT